MASNRIYPAETCPGCEEEFHPHRSNQIYCTEQCRINYHNDQRKLKNEERFGLEKILKHNDTTLESLYESNFYQDELIQESVLLGCDINLNACTLEKNLDTGRPVRWFHAYGVELVDYENRLYTIHHRTNF